MNRGEKVVESLSPLRATRDGSSRLHQELVKLYEDFSSGLTLDAVRRDGDSVEELVKLYEDFFERSDAGRSEERRRHVDTDW